MTSEEQSRKSIMDKVKRVLWGLFALMYCGFIYLCWACWASLEWGFTKGVTLPLVVLVSLGSIGIIFSVICFEILKETHRPNS